VAVIPHGVDLPRYRTLSAAQDAVAARIRAEAPGPRTLFVGRFVYYKGLDVLIEAMSRCPGTLILVGEGPLGGALRRQVAALGLGARVVFAGNVSNEELPAYYHASDVFVLPSVAESETYGLVQIEAMASGVPVVSTNLPTGVPWVNQVGVTGVVVPPRDPRALADALTRLGDNVSLRRTLGDNGRRRAETVFSRGDTVRTFRALIEATVREPRHFDQWLAHADPL
jgi:rhamnosyl/mannosyltransferase